MTKLDQVLDDETPEGPELLQVIESVMEHEQPRLEEVLGYVATDSWTPEYVYEFLQGLIEQHVEYVRKG